MLTSGAGASDSNSTRYSTVRSLCSALLTVLECDALTEWSAKVAIFTMLGAEVFSCGLAYEIANKCWVSFLERVFGGGRAWSVLIYGAVISTFGLGIVALRLMT